MISLNRRLLCQGFINGRSRSGYTVYSSLCISDNVNQIE